MLNKKQLAQLRREVIINSIYLRDYENTINIDVKDAYNFFSGYLDYLEDLMKEQKDYTDADFFKLLDVYDNIDNLLEYYYIYGVPFLK